MFYEEKLIGGIICWRNTPDGEWQESSKTALTNKIVALNDSHAELKEFAVMVNDVIQQWRESGREPAYGQWQNLQDMAQAAITNATRVK